MTRPVRIVLLACVPALAPVIAACGSSSDDSSTDAATDAALPSDAGVSPDSTLTDASVDASADGASLADVITSGPTTCTLQSGSRIKIRWYELADGGDDLGSRIFDSMYDTMLGVPCAPATTSDGKLRCLPVGQIGNPYFSDSACSTLVYQQSDFDCTIPSYIDSITYGGGCDAPTVAVYQVGAELPDGGTVYQTNGTDCSAVSWASIYNYYALSPVADSTFVEATAGTATAGNYSIATADFTDGARYCNGSSTVDTRTQVLSFVTSMSDGSNRMLPAAASSTGFADNACTAPATTTGSVGYAGGSCSPLAPYTEDFDQCSGAVTVRTIGSVIDAGWVSSVQDDGGVACTPADPLPEGGAWNALSDPLPPSTFDLVAAQPTGSGQVTGVTWETYGGFRFVIPDEGYDSQRAATCFVPSSEAPTASCFPPTSFDSGPLYTDSTCSTPLNLVSMPTSCVSSGFPPAGTTAYLSSCTSPHMVHVGAPYTGSMWQKVGNTCNDVGFPGDSFWSTVDDIDPSTYPQLTAVIE